MSEVKINLTDAQQTLHGTLHGSIVDAMVAALSAEPETIDELDAALERYQRRADDYSYLASLQTTSHIDERPWDAGIVVIDLAARVVASESTYSRPAHEGRVSYHNGEQATDVSIEYKLPDDWLFVESIENYLALYRARRAERAATPPLDGRAVLYGRPLFEWLVDAIAERRSAIDGFALSLNYDPSPSAEDTRLAEFAKHQEKINQELAAVHSQWLMTPRDDLRGMSPRDLMLLKQDLIDYDLETRALQWTFLREGPPCLAKESFAFKYGGFGTHEWIIYYELVRCLLWNSVSEEVKGLNRESQIERLEQLSKEWLESPQPDYDGKTPAILIENERKRLPIALGPAEVMIDPDCPLCRQMAEDAALGIDGPTFWHLDTSAMEEEFAFSCCRTRDEWEQQQREYEEFSKKFDRKSRDKEEQSAISDAVQPLYESYINAEENKSKKEEDVTNEVVQ